MKIPPQAKIAAFAAAIVALALADKLDEFPVLAAAIKVLAAAAAFILLLFPDTGERPQRDVKTLSFPVAALLGAIGAVSGVLAWVHGAPAFAHDWKWPLDTIQSHDQLKSLASIWLTWGSGAPGVQALGNYPIAIVSWALGYLFPANVSLLVLLAVIGAIAGCGTSALAAQTGLSRAYQIALALSIAATPAWFNRLNAGHLEWLLGYALFPAGLALAMSSARNSRAAGGLGAFWGIAGGQAQFLLFFPLATLPFLVRRRRGWAFGVAFVLMLVLQLPAIVAMAFAVHVNAFAQQHANLTWQLAQSDPLSLALISGADPAHYFAQWQDSAAFILSFAVLLLASIGSFRTASTRLLSAIWLVSAVWSSGLDGPLAAPIAWLFLHVPNAVALREFAHTQAITAPTLCLLTALGIARIIERAKAPAVYGGVLAFCALLPLTWAAFSGAIARTTPGVAPSADRSAAVKQIAELAGDGQVLWWPGLAPIAFNNARGGVDGEAFQTGDHTPYAEYRPTAALAHAVTALNTGDTAACGLLADLGIQAVVVRDGTLIPPDTTFSTLDVPTATNIGRSGLHAIARYGAYRIYEVPCYRGRFTFAADSTLTGDWSSIVPIARRFGATDEQTLPPAAPHSCKIRRFDDVAYRSTDITQQWVPLSELDKLFLKFDNAFEDVYVTNDSSRRLTRWVLAAGPYQRYTWMPPDRANAILGQNLAIWQTADCIGSPARAISKPPDNPASIAQSLASPTIVALKPTLAVAHYARTAGWSLVLNGEPAAESIPADGFATGWLIPAGRWRVAIVASGPPIGLLWAAVLLSGVACLALMTLPLRKQ